MKKKTKIYLSGRMSGLPADTWRWRFAMVQIILEIRGHKVVNPADSIIARHPWLYKLVGYRWTLWYDLQMLQRCTHIKMVYNDWRQSKGARLERLKAREWNIPEIMT